MWRELFKYPPETPEQRLRWEAVFLAIFILGGVGIFGRMAIEDSFYTGIISIIFVVNLTFRFIFLNEKGDWLFFVLGVIVGGGNDLMSMIQEVYFYHSATLVPILDGLLPLWMIVFWGQGFLVLRKVFNLSWIKGEEFKPRGQFLKGWVDKTLLFDLCIIVILRVVIYHTVAMDWWIPGLIYGGIVLLRYIIIPPTLNQLNIMVIMPYAFIFEALLCNFGLYDYINPVFLGMPMWLFFWWLFLMPTIVHAVFKRLEYYVNTAAIS